MKRCLFAAAALLVLAGNAGAGEGLTATDTGCQARRFKRVTGMIHHVDRARKTIKIKDNAGNFVLVKLDAQTQLRRGREIVTLDKITENWRIMVQYEEKGKDLVARYVSVPPDLRTGKRAGKPAEEERK